MVVSRNCEYDSCDQRAIIEDSKGNNKFPAIVQGRSVRVEIAHQTDHNGDSKDPSQDSYQGTNE